MMLKRWKSVGICAAFLLALSFAHTTPASADCTESTFGGGNYNGSAAANNISCDGDAPNAATNVNGNDGDDTIEIQTGFTVTNNVSGGNDNDTITIMGGTVTNNVTGGAGDDTITLTNPLSSIGGNIIGGTGLESILLQAGTLTGSVQMNDGGGSVNVTGNFSGNSITATAGFETVTVSALASIGNINLGDGGSQLNIFGAAGFFVGGDAIDTVMVHVGGSIGVINTLENDDSVTINGTATGNINTGAGLDTVVIGNGTDAATVLDISTGGDADDVTIANAATAGAIATSVGDDVVEMRGTSGTINTGDGNDEVFLADRVTPLGASVAANSGDINLGANDDELTINTTGNTGALAGQDGNDSIFIQRAGTVNSITGGDGLDLITMIQGTVTNDVNAGNDADTIQIFGATFVTGNVIGGANTDLSIDQIAINTSGTIGGDVRGGGGADSLTLTLGTVSGAIQGQDGEDTLNLNGGSITGNASGGADNDTINLAGSIVTGDLNGGQGDDQINMSAGQAGGVLGGTGADNFAFSGGLILGDVNMGADNDTVTVSGAANPIGVTSWNGGANTDLLEFQGLTAGVSTAVNWEEIAVTMGADITFSSAAGYTTTGNGFRVNGATARFSALTNSWTGDWNLQSANVFIENGVFGITGNVGMTNSNLSLVNGMITDNLQITGNVNSSGGILSLDVALGDDTSLADYVTVNGAVLGGPVLLSINNLGGLGGQTTNGIVVVDDAASAAGDYALAGPVVVGAFQYSLLQDGNFWELHSGISDHTGAYASAVSIAQNHTSALVGPLSERMRDLGLGEAGGGEQSASLGASDVQLADAGTAMGDFGGLAVWGKVFGQIGDYSPDNRSGVDVAFDQTTQGFAFGAEGGFGGLFADEDRLFAGAQIGYGTSDADMVSGADVGIDGWSFGVYATYRAQSASPQSGLYVDALLLAAMMDVDVSDPSIALQEEYEAQSLVASLEAGYGIDLGGDLILQPQAQLSWIDVNHDDFTDGVGTTVSLEEGTSLEGRLGLRLQQHWHLYSLGHVAPYLEANLLHEFEAANEISASGLLIDSSMDGTSYSIGGGLDAVVGGVTLFGDVDITWGDAIDQEVQAVAGARVSF